MKNKHAAVLFTGLMLSSLGSASARYYEPSTGRFLQEDPIMLVSPGDQFLPRSLSLYTYADSVGKPSLNLAPYFDGVRFGSTNLYHYTYNNPVNNTDPNGTFVFLGAAGLTGTLLVTGYAIYFAYGVGRNIQEERDVHGNLTAVYWEAPIYWKSTPFPWLTGLRIDMTLSERRLLGEKWSYPQRLRLIYPPPSTQYCVGSGI